MQGNKNSSCHHDLVDLDIHLGFDYVRIELQEMEMDTLNTKMDTLGPVCELTARH